MLERLLAIIQTIRHTLEAWIQFGLLAVIMIIAIPLYAVIGTILILLPFITFAFGLLSGGLVGVYVIAVMAGTATYCILKYKNGDDADSPIVGARIDSEAKARAKSRSRIQGSRFNTRKGL